MINWSPTTCSQMCGLSMPMCVTAVVGDGPLKISAGLQPRKIAAALLKQALYADGPDWVELCRQALQKKFRLHGKPAAAELQRIQRFLLQRGYTGEQIRQCLKINRDSEQ